MNRKMKRIILGTKLEEVVESHVLEARTCVCIEQFILSRPEICFETSPCYCFQYLVSVRITCHHHFLTVAIHLYFLYSCTDIVCIVDTHFTRGRITEKYWTWHRKWKSEIAIAVVYCTSHFGQAFPQFFLMDGNHLHLELCSLHPQQYLHQAKWSRSWDSEGTGGRRERKRRVR